MFHVNLELTSTFVVVMVTSLLLQYENQITSDILKIQMQNKKMFNLVSLHILNLYLTVLRG